MNFEILLSSIGGVGSTWLFDFVSRFKRPNANHFVPGTPEGKFKHMMKPIPLPNVSKAIFVIGNVYNSAISLLDNEFINKTIPCTNPGHLKNKGLLNVQNNQLEANKIPLTEYFEKGVDIYQTREQIYNWCNPEPNVNYPIMIVKYESLANRDTMEKICDFLDIDKKHIDSMPPFIPRTGKNLVENSPIKEGLYRVYGDAQQYVDSLDDIFIVEKKT